jgi:CheY-like chemotaxis protein
MMPGTDGIEATKIIRSMDDRKDTVIIALTANAVTGMEELFLKSGMNGFLPKPIILKNLQAILLKHLPMEKIVST